MGRVIRLRDVDGMSQKKIYVELLGGLGNQLFGVSAALHAAWKSDAELVLDKSQISKGLTNHGVSISDLDFFCQGQPMHFQTVDARPMMLKSRVFLRALLSRLMGQKSRLWFPLIRTYYSTSVGYEHDFDFFPDRSFIQGYFQSYVYFENLRRVNKAFEIAPTYPSEWYSSLAAECRELRPVMIHMRRGDYKGLSDFGLLSGAYYKEALDVLYEKDQALASKEIWLFSDEVDLALGSLAAVGIHPDRTIVPPEASSAAESLALMTKGSGIVIANSTFSWWAAMLGDYQGLVVCPTEWFRSMPAPEKLIPPNWSRSGSLWEE